MARYFSDATAWNLSPCDISTYSDRARIQGFADVFNVFNAGTALTVNQTYGAVAATNAWLTPTSIMAGRFVRFGLQMTF